MREPLAVAQSNDGMMAALVSWWWSPSTTAPSEPRPEWGLDPRKHWRDQ